MNHPTPKTERDFRRQVRAYAEQRGWDVHFEIDSRFKHDSGFPDLVLGRKKTATVVRFRELKMPGKYLSARQDDWKHLLQGAGLDWDVWRPEDWPRIEEELA